MTKLLVCGGRDYNDREFLYEKLDEIVENEGPIEVVIHGDASGADTLADEWAKERKIPTIAVPAEWRKYGRAAGPMRNRQMLEHLPDVAIAFSGGKGTNDMVRLLKAAGVALYDPYHHYE